MLHFDLVHQNILASSFNEAVEEKRARNRAEKEHVQKNKNKKEGLKILRNLEGQ